MQRVKTNLMFFIKPTILRDNKQVAFETNAKYNLIRDLQLEQESTVKLLPSLQAEPRDLRDLGDFAKDIAENTAEAGKEGDRQREAEAADDGIPTIDLREQEPAPPAED